MKCVICKHGETEPGTVTVALERGGATLVFRNVPAQVCANCGEAYLDEEQLPVCWSARTRQRRAGYKRKCGSTWRHEGRAAQLDTAIDGNLGA